MYNLLKNMYDHSLVILSQEQLVPDLIETGMLKLLAHGDLQTMRSQSIAFQITGIGFSLN